MLLAGGCLSASASGLLLCPALSGDPLAILARVQGRGLQLGNCTGAVALEDRVAVCAESAGQLPTDVRIAAHQSNEHVLLLPSGKPRDPVPQRVRRGIDRCQRLARLSRRRHQVFVQPQEVDHSSQRTGQVAKTRRDGRLELVLLQHPGLHREQPRQVEQPAVTHRQLRTHRNDRAERLLGVLVPVLVLLLARQRHDHAVAGSPGAGGVGRAVATDDAELEHGRGKPEHELPGPPVGEVEGRVEVGSHQRPRVGSQVAPLVGVHEMGRSDPRTTGYRPKFLLLTGVEWSVDGEELVKLVLAHCRASPSVTADRLTVRPCSDIPADETVTEGTRTALPQVTLVGGRP